MNNLSNYDLQSEPDSLTILVIDDGPVNVKMLESTLSKEGYSVFSAFNGPDGRKCAEECGPDLIILDVMMPGEDGFEVIKKLQENHNTASIPVIFLTGKDDFESKIRGFNLGAVDYLIKPCHPLEVKARVRLHLKLSMATNMLIANQAERLKQIREAQHSILTIPENHPEAKCGVYYSALLEAGGDFYDIFKISDNIYGYFVADVSGHDIKTSFITPSVKALLKQNCTPVFSPIESMKMINNVLVELLADGKYLTACYCKLNRVTMIMSVVSAGHPPVLYIPVDNEARFIEMNCDVLGIMLNAHYEQQNITVSKGDRFFLYSDGLIEKIGEKKIWTETVHELLTVSDKLRDVPISESAEMLKNLMLDNEINQDDDIVVLGIEV